MRFGRGKERKKEEKTLNVKNKRKKKYISLIF